MRTKVDFLQAIDTIDFVADSPKRVNKNRATVTLIPKRIEAVKAVEFDPIWLRGGKPTVGGKLGVLLDAVWPLLERCGFDPIQIRAEIDARGLPQKKGNQGR